MACHWLRRSWNVSRIQVLPVAPLFRSRLLASNQPSRYGKVMKHLILQFFVIWYLACFKPAQQSLIWKVMWYVNLQNITLFYKIWHILSNHPKSLLHCCSAPGYLLQTSSAEFVIEKCYDISHCKIFCDVIFHLEKYFVIRYLTFENILWHNILSC